METPRDQNHVTAKMGILCTDGVTLVPIAITPDGAMIADLTSTISFTPENIARRDENHVPVWLGQSDTSSDVLPIYVNASGYVLMDL